MFSSLKFKSVLGRNGGSARRREELRRALPPPAFGLGAMLQKPEFINTGLILAGFLAIVSVVVIWSREQVKVRDGQIMSSTRIKRLDYQVQDVEATKAKRDEARKSSPRIYRINTSYLERLNASLLGLPKAVAGKISLEEISPDLQKEFALTEGDLSALGALPENEASAELWQAAVGRLVNEQLLWHPPILSQEYETYITKVNYGLLLPNGDLRVLKQADAIELKPDPLGALGLADPRLRELVLNSGFTPPLAPVVLKRLLSDPQPVLLYSEEESTRLAREREAAVQPEWVKHVKGDVLYRRGEMLSPEQYSNALIEAAEYRTSSTAAWERWKARIGTVGLIAIVSFFLGSFATIAYPRIVRNSLRIAAVCTLMATLLAATTLIATYAPIFLLPAAIGPVLFVSVILLVAYDQRLALLCAGLQCMMVTLALEQSIGFFILLMAGCATIIAQLRELRHRNSLIRAATVTAAVMGFGTILLTLLELPMVEGALQQMLVMAFSTVGTVYGIAFLVLGILPSVEKLFDITTGMTLAELRDPKRPLLRQLQQRAPGTYNHSLQVANIAEAAADAIAADSLLVYVGALYHDIGKINKPDYFVENQISGYNKHDKLSPAMSLLVIIGHVKNGIELAREYGLPRPIIHFIESHHGTTLVEYFYHAAREQAELTDQSVAEIEYRYSGPKPQTKEAAILMLADSIESATRSIEDPTPSRIENLVRRLSQKRMEDGQFDECELTFKELTTIENAMIARLLSIYHGRISYPTSAEEIDEADREGESPIAPTAKPISA